MSLCKKCKHFSSDEDKIIKCTINSSSRHHSFRGKPAIEFKSGTKYWYKNGLVHREDGPALEYANGAKSWYYNDSRYSKQELESLIKNKKKLITFDSNDKKFQVSIFILVVGIVLGILFK